MSKTWNSYQDVKVCLHAITADESEALLDRWLDNVKRADRICVLVTKTDNPNYSYLKYKQTLPDFKDKLIVSEKMISPWRFDVARNESLKLVPEGVDVLVSTDIDELLIEDFWDDLRKAVFNHPDFDRIHYKYAWNHDSDGNPALVYWYDKITRPAGVYWKYPVHETLMLEDNEKAGETLYLDESKIYLKHFPDSTKPSGHYLSLIELRVKEDPTDVASLNYLVREYLMCNRPEEAFKVANWCISIINEQGQDKFSLLPVLWNYIGDILISTNVELAYSAYLRAVDTVPYKESFLKMIRLKLKTHKVEDAEELFNLMQQSSVPTNYDWRQSFMYQRPWVENYIKALIELEKGNFKQAHSLIEGIDGNLTEEDAKLALVWDYYVNRQIIQDRYDEYMKIITQQGVVEDEYAYITLLSDDSYLPGVLKIASSLKLLESKYPLYSLVTEDVSDDARFTLWQAGVKVLPVEGIHVSREFARNFINEDGSNLREGQWKWHGGMSKLLIWSLTAFKKVVYLDADLWVRQNIDELFDMPAWTAYKDWSPYPVTEYHPGELNSGLLVIEPNKEDFEGLMEVYKNWPRTEICHDQAIIQRYKKDWKHQTALHLPETYVPSLLKLCIEKDFYLRHFQDIKVIHFIGDKPWKTQPEVIIEISKKYPLYEVLFKEYLIN